MLSEGAQGPADVQRAFDRLVAAVANFLQKITRAA
jgi:hypothetical protein